MKNSYIGQAWLVIVLAICFGGALAGVETALRPRIEANQRALTLDQIPELVPGAVKPEEETRPETVGEKKRQAYRAFDETGRQIGWVVKASGQGFADKITLLIGLNAKATTITGLFVLDQKETPGLGDKIREAEWRRQFSDKSTAEKVGCVKAEPAEGNNILALSGATISSDSVCKIVNKAVAELRDELAAAVKE